jgi:hypothetical protein
LGYAAQEVEGTTGIQFDTAGFGAVAPGLSQFLNDNDQLHGRFDYRRGPWRFHLMASIVEADGFNNIIDLTAMTPSLANSVPIVQSYDNAEVGLDYVLPSGIWVGGTYRDFDYDDVNNRLDYSGSHVVLRAGMTF